VNKRQRTNDVAIRLSQLHTHFFPSATSGTGLFRLTEIHPVFLR